MMSEENPKIKKYLDKNGVYNPYLSERVREEYKNNRVFKEYPASKFIKSVFKEKEEHK